MKFKAELELNGKAATGIEVPPKIIEQLGAGRQPPVKVTLKKHTYRTVLWQALAVVVTACVTGIPLGVAAGRISWRITVSQLHIDAGPIMPAWAPFALVAGGAALITAVALVPALWARQLRIANALRSE